MTMTDQNSIWLRWKSGRNTAQIARSLKLEEYVVAKAVAQGLDAVYCDRLMPWNRSQPRIWTKRDENVLRQHYRTGGYAPCLSRLIGKSKCAIKNKAARMGLVADKPGRRKLVVR